ncbi:DUF6193 family natural product biosynthesis protein [Micromonospora chersina]|uniref:DUF6193 family natural product biosynthesis protein n=1 Tax=Micromonospora chersina TaxID=47854 RepID=UPI003CA25DD4
MPGPWFAQLYPDVAAANSLATALHESAKRQGLDLNGITAASGWPTSAVLAREDRAASVQLGSEERCFIIELRGRAVALSSGTYPELDVTAGVLHWWGSGTTLTDLHRRYAFMSASSLALAYEAGTEVEAKWRSLREAATGEVRLAVEAAAARPVLRGLFPFLSHQTLCFSRCTVYPYSRDVPAIQPLGGDRFRVLAPDGTTAATDITAEEAAGVVVAHLPPDCGPAVPWTARDSI